MTISELRNSLKPQQKFKINNETYTVLEHIVWWQAKANQTYDKYVLEDSTGDNTTRMFISGGLTFIGLAKLIHYDFQEPMHQELTYNGESFTLTQDEFCLVKATEGEEFYKVGEGEIWWDYSNNKNDGTGLSLGRSWETWKREDLATQEVNINTISLV